MRHVTPPPVRSVLLSLGFVFPLLGRQLPTSPGGLQAARASTGHASPPHWVGPVPAQRTADKLRARRPLVRPSAPRRASLIRLLGIGRLARGSEPKDGHGGEIRGHRRDWRVDDAVGPSRPEPRSAGSTDACEQRDQDEQDRARPRERHDDRSGNEEQPESTGHDSRESNESEIEARSSSAGTAVRSPKPLTAK